MRQFVDPAHRDAHRLDLRTVETVKRNVLSDGAATAGQGQPDYRPKEPAFTALGHGDGVKSFHAANEGSVYAKARLTTATATPTNSAASATTS